MGIRTEPNHRKKTGLSGKSSSHLLGGPSVQAACGNVQVLLEGVLAHFLRVRDKQIQHLPIMKLKGEKLNATQRVNFLAQ